VLEGVPPATTCRILQLSRASYYRYLDRQRKGISEHPVHPVSEDELLPAVREIAGLHSAWGYRRITSFLRRKRGLLVNRKRVHRLMRLHGLCVPQIRHKAKRTETRSKPRPTRPNEWWGTDMTKFFVNGLGWVYLVVVLDWYTKRALGYSLSLRSTKAEWLLALHRAVEVACPRGSREYGIHLMSDNGSQPTSDGYEKELLSLGIVHVTTSYNNPKGNADTERFMRTFKEEAIWPNELSTFEEAIRAVEVFFRFYNEDYPHSTPDGMSPIDFEQSPSQTTPPAAA
jgi:putative transposase